MTDQSPAALTDIRVLDRDERPAVSIAIQEPLTGWDRVNALIDELAEWMPAHQANPVGAPFYSYRRIGDLTVPFDLSVGFELTAPVDGDQRVGNEPIPAGRYLVGRHNGHPDRISASHQALLDHARDNGMHVLPRPEGDPRVGFLGMYETYLSDPAEQPDPNDWVTELAYLIA